ncbi:MAG: hypothetical protein J6K04_00415 [Lachnospiraceae bacterium]|nr:hypothetical protein [Lachnospiraceae bacterium]
MGHLDNLRLLKDDMASKGWSICDFLFKYKGTEYIVLVKRFVGAEKRKSQYALVKLHFMKNSNIYDELQVEVNSKGLLIETKKLRSYFGIEYTTNLGNILEQFSERLGRAIPKEMPDTKTITVLEKKAMVASLSKSDSEDPRKIYCTGVKRNPKGQTRSDFNADKTKLLRENLYKNFANDPGISFCYSADASKEKDDAAIYINFANK